MMRRPAVMASALALVAGACTLDFGRLPRGEGRGDGPGLDRLAGAEPPKLAQACAPGFSRVDVSSPLKMAGCTCTSAPAICSYAGLAYGLKQCDAASACNSDGGWRACTLTDYAKVTEAIPLLATFWLAGCVVGGQPQDTVCDCPTSCGGPDTTVAYTCSISPKELKSPCPSVAIRAASLCMGLGVGGSPKKGFWDFLDPTGSMHGVVCCHD